MKYLKQALLALVAVIGFVLSPDTAAQRIALKTNVLDYVILSPNLTFEAQLSRRLSLQLGLSVNPIQEKIGGVKLNTFRVEPELRYWFNRPMARHFIAASVTGADFSFSGFNRNYMGETYWAGVSYGYALVLSRHWNVEFEVGAGLGYFRGFSYRDDEPVPDTVNWHTILPVPVRCGISFAYIFK